MSAEIIVTCSLTFHRLYHDCSGVLRKVQNVIQIDNFR